MPVNTAALKTFAPAMRRQLLEAVGRKLDLLLHSQTPDTLSTYARQIAELREQEAENREQLLERVAYTWFNRLCALRYLDARCWHPFGCKVLMPAAEGETQPELLKLMRAGSLPAELKPHTKETRLHGLLDGQIPPAIAGADPQGEVYRELVLASCRSYHQLLPELFEGLDDASELLLPDDLLSEGSIGGGFRSAISDADCEDVEIIGWLYQFYISEKKDDVMSRKKKLFSQDVPAATQLFTPHWIVKYLVENTLGRTWLSSHPSSRLREHMEYYIETQQDALELECNTISSPEELQILDPACGSGHMLTYAFDLLAKIYEEEGYQLSEIAPKILTCNIFGREVCPRASQLARLALFFKAREISKGAFRRTIPVNIVCYDELCIDSDTAEVVHRSVATSQQKSLSKSAKILASEIQAIGSLIRFTQKIIESPKQPPMVEAGQQSLLDGHQIVRTINEQLQNLSIRPNVILTNPPYLNGRSIPDPQDHF